MSDETTRDERDGDDPVAPTQRFGAEDPVAPTRRVDATGQPAAAPPSGSDSSQRRSGATIGGRYRLESRLNAGGMGEVYLAQPLNANQKVVVKFPHVHLLDSPEFLARFDQEVEALVNLTHNHIVEVYDAGQDRVVEGGRERTQPYLVVRYMSGGSLRDRIASQGGRLACSAAQFSWLRPIAQALDFVHAQGVVHRDVKPENLLFDAFGVAYLSDFGIAKLTHSGVELTVEGVLGSIHYIAPEYASRSYTAQFDQYSLAVIVYQALSGSLPHSGESMTLLANKATRPPEPLSDKVRDVPPALEQAVLRGLAREPHARFPSCAAFADAVLAAIETAEVHRARMRRGLRATLIALPLVAVVGYAGWRILTEPDTDTGSGEVAELLQKRVAAIGSQERTTRSELDALAGRARAISAALPELESGLEKRAREVEAIAREIDDSTDPRSLKLADLKARLREVDRDRERAANALPGASELRRRTLSLQRQLEDLRRDLSGAAQALREQTTQLREVAEVKGGGSNELKLAIAELEGRGVEDEERRGTLQRDLDRIDAAVAGLPARLDQLGNGLSERAARLERLHARLEERRALLERRDDATPNPPLLNPNAEPIAKARRKLVAIPGGPFFFGCNPSASDACESPGSMQDEPAFEIDRSEVSVAEYAECVSGGGCTKPRGLSKDCNWGKAERADHPINCVDFLQAGAYCGWVGKDLPTERQWEKAARGLDGAPFPWGSEPASCERAVYSDCSKTTAPAESRPLNPSGVRNMAGNVWEWTTTLEGEDLVVVRGGSFRNNARDMRADRRSFVGKPTNTDGAGFRCVRNP